MNTHDSVINNWSRPGLYLRSLCWFVAMIFAVSAQAETNMTDVQFNSLPGGKVEMRFIFDDVPPEPKVYTIESPARIALDLKDVSSKLKQKKHTLDLGNTQSVVVVQSGNRTRVIVNLLELTKYDMNVDQNDLVVIVGNDGIKDYLKETPAQLDEKVSTQVVSQISSLDFRRGENGEGRLLIELTNPNIDVDTRVEGEYIKLSFLDTALPESLRLKYDVSDFATPVQIVNADEVDGVAKIELKPTGEYEYLAYQTDTSYVLTVKPLTAEEIEARKKEFEWVGDKLSLNFQDIEIRAVLQLIADFTDLNLVASDTVKGKITLRLQNVPWDQALDLILKTKGLDKRQDGNVLLVAPAAEIAKREKQEIQTNKQLEELAPLQTEFIRIKYADAGDIYGILQGAGGGGTESSGALLSNRATAVVDERTNSLLITETASKLEEVRRLINLIDVPIRQVLIEARIVLANSEQTDTMGITWGGGYAKTRRGGSVVGVSPSSDQLTGIASGAPSLSYQDVVDLGVEGLEGATSISMGYLNEAGTGVLGLTLSALEDSGNGEIVSQPKVITGDKQQAMIKTGKEVAYQESSASGASTTSFIDATLTLDVTPSITPDDRVLMDLTINQDSVGGLAPNNALTIDTTEIKTQVLVDNGATVVLGGVFQTTDVESVIKTPFFGDIPYLGRLFKRTNKEHVKTETLIFITPRILADTLVD